MIRRSIAILLLAAAPLLPACGGVYEVDAKDAIDQARIAVREELNAQRQALEILVDRVADIVSRGSTVQVDVTPLRELYDRLQADLASVREQLRQAEAEARDRVNPPPAPASGVAL